MDANIRAAYAKIDETERNFEILRRQVESGDVTLKSNLEKFVFLNFAEPWGKGRYEERLSTFQKLDERLQESKGEELVVVLERRQVIYPSNERGIVAVSPKHRAEYEVLHGLLNGGGLEFSLKSFGMDSPPITLVAFPVDRGHERFEYKSSFPNYYPHLLEKPLEPVFVEGRPEIPLKDLVSIAGLDRKVLSHAMSTYDSKILIGKEATEYVALLRKLPLINKEE